MAAAHAPISASHLSLWKRCKRREAFVYRLGRRENATLAAEAGKQVHAVLEDHYKRGVPLDFSARWGDYPVGKLAERILRELPPANDNSILGVEEEFAAELEGITFHGIRDLRTATGVYDHKTTSQLKYAKTQDDLVNDVQRLIYTESEPAAEFAQWTTAAWAGGVCVSRMPVDRAADRERFRLHVLTPAEEMLSFAPDVDPLSLPPSLDDCKLFPPRGCPFKPDCFPESRSMLVALAQTLRPSTESTPPVVPEPSAEPAVPTTHAHLIDTLFIDCYPLKPLDEPVVNSYELLAAANQVVSNDLGVHHALLVDYGKGATMVACEVKALLEEKPVKYLVWESRSTEGRSALTTLVPLARVVIKGVY